MNQSTGLSHLLLNKYLCKKEAKSTQPETTDTNHVKSEPGLDEFDARSSSGESANSDINDLNYLPEEELQFLKHKPKLKKKVHLQKYNLRFALLLNSHTQLIWL